VFGPVAHPAAAYDEAVPIADDAPADAELRAGLHARALSGVELTRDGRLDLAATELARIAARGAVMSPGLVEFALQAQGVVEPARAIIARGANATERLAALEPQLANTNLLGFPNTRMGIHGDATLAVIVLVHSVPVKLTSAPREIHRETTIAGLLESPFRTPRITVTHDDRTTEGLLVSIEPGGVFHAPLRCGVHTGTQWVAIEADAEPGPLAVFPVACNTPPATTFRVEPAENLTTPDIEKRIAAMVNRERIAAQLAPLDPDAPSQLAARHYAEAMGKVDDVAHDLDHTTPASRLEAVGRSPILVSETTVKGDNLGRTTEILLNDPLYRSQVVDKNVTRMGVGAAFGKNGELYLCIEYIQIPPIVDPVAIEDVAIDQLMTSGHTVRMNYRASPDGHGTSREIAARPDVDDELTMIAHTVASDIAAGWPSADTLAWMERQLAGEVRYSGAGMRVVQLTSTKVDIKDMFPVGQIIDNIGVAVVQSGREGPQSGRIWLVVCFARY
jgi:uncharacterized protein YkwD